MATSLAELLGLAGARLLPQIGAAGPAVKQPASGDLRQARAAAQAPSVLPRVGTVTAEPEYLPPDAAMGGAPALLPAVGGAPPQMTNPLRQAMIAAQDRVDNDLTPRRPFHDLSGWGKVGRVLGTIGDVAGTVFAPEATMMIPGSSLNRAMRTSNRLWRAGAADAGWKNKAETQARGEEEVGLRRQQLEDAENKQPANPWAEMKDYFGPNGEPVERHTMTGEIRMVPLPAGVTRNQPALKQPTDAFDQWMRDPAQYQEFMAEMAKIKGGGKAEQGAYGGFGPAFMAYRMLQSAYNENPALLPIIAPKVAQILGEPGAAAQLAQVPAGQPRDDQGNPIGRMMPGAPTGATRSRGQFAEAIRPAISDASKEITQLGDQLGPFQGRWNEFYQGKLGADAPQYAGLRTELHNVATAWMRLHANSDAAREDFLKTLRTAQTPADLISSLNSIDQQAQDYVKAGQGRPDKLGVGGAGGFQVRLSDAMGLPQNKGKSEAEVRKDVEAHGGTVVQ